MPQIPGPLQSPRNSVVKLQVWEIIFDKCHQGVAHSFLDFQYRVLVWQLINIHSKGALAHFA